MKPVADAPSIASAGTSCAGEPSKRAIHVAEFGQAIGDVPVDVRHSCQMLSRLGWKVTLVTVAEAPRPADVAYRTETFANALRGAPVLSKLQASPAMRRFLRRTLPQTDVIHAHGLWVLPGFYAADEAWRARTPTIIAPRGMLAPEALRYGRLQKRLAWWAHQRRALSRAACLHASSDQEYLDIRTAGIKTPVAVIPLDAGLCGELDAAPSDRRDKIVLSLGRLHPIKGLDTLIAAWARIENQRPGWRLQIAGPSEGDYETTLRNLAETSGALRIDFVGALFGAAKTEAFARASLFVLPSRSESFALTVPEALSCGVPVLACRGSPWEALREHGCGWWIDGDANALASGLLSATSLPPLALQQMGREGRSWVNRAFSSEALSLRLDAVYRWMLRRADAPGDLRFE